MAWGPLSDHFGRRPIFLVCLLILILSCVGLALTPTSAFWLLMLLRCVQAVGCASTIAIGTRLRSSELGFVLTLQIGAGVIGDISEPWQRGTYFAMFNLGPMVCAYALGHADLH
jgi:MFS family permease